jgi:DNA polymerase
MYWKTPYFFSCSVFAAPVSTQALIVEAFREVTGDEESADACNVWLLKQKQTQDWTTTCATADAIYALLLGGGTDLLAGDALAEVTLGGEKVVPEKVEAGTGMYAVRYAADKIRSEMGKTSNKKYEAMLSCVGRDDRVRGLLQFYGSRTGRWAGRLVQVQNLPQNHIKDIDFARTCLLENDIEMIELGYGNVSDILSQLIRTAFIAGPGKTFVVCDFSAIEARVLAWLAGEQWVLDTFRQGGDIYCATASQMFHVPVEKHGQNAELRQKGKIAVLALGYGGAVSALDAMGGQRMGMTEQEEADTVRKWRAANPNIVSFWSRVESAATECVVTKAITHVGPLEFKMHGKTMTIQLPSGRLISYPDIQPCTNRFGSSSLKYHGLDQQTNKWVWIETYGGKLTENIVQATARDCLAEALTTIGHGHDVVFHVHDEIICEVPEDKAERTLDWVKEVFSQNASWNEGLPLCGAGYITPYYLKD